RNRIEAEASSSRLLAARLETPPQIEARSGQEMARRLQPRVSLLGRVSLEADGRAVDEARFPGRQGRLVFAYLVAERGRAVPRDELAEALWADARPPTWDKALTGIVS